MPVTAFQLEDAAALWAIVQLRNIPVMPDRVALAVICCVLDESSLLNVTHGDVAPDGTPTTSLGFFQQKAGYGTAQARLDPAIAVTAFLDGGPDSQPAFLKQPYMTGTLDDLARCIQNVQQSQYNGKDIDPSTGKPYVFAQNYINNMPVALDILRQIKSSLFAGVRHELMKQTAGIAQMSGATRNINLWTAVTV